MAETIDPKKIDCDKSEKSNDTKVTSSNKTSSDATTNGGIEKKSVKFGEVKDISSAEMAKLKKVEIKKPATSIINKNFHMLHAGAQTLLPKTSATSAQKKKASDNSSDKSDKAKGGSSSVADNVQNSKKSTESKNGSDDCEVVVEEEIVISDDNAANENSTVDENMDTSDSKKSKVIEGVMGEVKTIAPSEMANISSTVIKKQSQMAAKTVHKNFLMLHAGASTLLPQKVPKRKATRKSSPEPKETSDKSPSRETKETKRSKSSSSKTRKYDDDEDSDYSSRHESNYKNLDPYYCEVCDTPLNSEQTYVSHIEGKKHQKKLKAQEQLSSKGFNSEELQYMKVKEGCRINRIPKLGAVPSIQADLEGMNAPLVGLDFISEILRIDESQGKTYYCALCCTTCQAVAIISHILGFKHRLAYMKLFDPVNYESVKKISTKKSDLTALLERFAVALEKLHGSGQIKVEEEVSGYVAERRERRHSDYDDSSSSGFGTRNDDLAVLPPRRRIQFVEEAVINCSISEVTTSQQVNVLVLSTDNLKESLIRYNGVASDPLVQQRILRLLSNDSLNRVSPEPSRPVFPTAYNNPRMSSSAMPQSSFTGSSGGSLSSASGRWAPFDSAGSFRDTSRSSMLSGNEYSNLPSRNEYSNLPSRNEYSNIPSRNEYSNLPSRNEYSNLPSRNEYSNLPSRNEYSNLPSGNEYSNLSGRMYSDLREKDYPSLRSSQYLGSSVGRYPSPRL